MPYKIKRLTPAQVLAAAGMSAASDTSVDVQPPLPATAPAAAAAAETSAAETSAAAETAAAPASAELQAPQRDHKRQRQSERRTPPHGWLESAKGGEHICGLCPVKTPLSQSYSTSPSESWTPAECVEVIVAHSPAPSTTMRHTDLPFIGAYRMRPPLFCVCRHAVDLKLDL